MEIEGNPYYRDILNKIEDYQKGQISLEELKRIPKEDLLEAMREECKRISSRINTINGELSSYSSRNN